MIETNLSSIEESPKISGLNGNSNPDLCDARCRCTAPPVTLSGQLGAGRYVGR